MKILHINNYFAGRFFFKNLYDIQEKENEIIVAVPVMFGYREKYCYGPYVRIVRCFNFLDKMLFFPRIIKAKRAIYNQIDTTNVNVIHAHSLFTNGSIARLLARQLAVPYVVTVRNVDVNKVFKKLFFLRGYGKRLLLSANQVLFLSDSVKDIVLEHYCPELDINKCKVITNGVDDFWIRNKKGKDSEPAKNSLKILYVGEINRNKNLIQVAKCINILLKHNDFENVSYTIIGKIMDSSVYRELCKFDFVTIFDYMEKNELIKHYANADIYVMISHTESFGITYLEALSQGTPIIYSKGQGIDGVFDEGVVGYHVDPHSSEELIDKIYRILGDYSRISKNCSELISDYSWKNISDKLQAMYDDVETKWMKNESISYSR